ncbi:hypothetical protein SANTM175S_10046 [Streptomyces antimycoticus]
MPSVIDAGAGPLAVARPSSPSAVTVTELGSYRLEGQLDRHSEIPIAVRMTGQVDGVVAVVDRLTYLIDDSAGRGGARR